MRTEKKKKKRKEGRKEQTNKQTNKWYPFGAPVHTLSTAATGKLKSFSLVTGFGWTTGGGGGGGREKRYLISNFLLH